jgi:hypothetical protein
MAAVNVEMCQLRKTIVLFLLFIRFSLFECRDVLPSFNRSTLESKFENIRDGGSKEIEFKVSDKDECKATCGKEWMENICRGKTKCRSFPKCRDKDKCSCRLKLKCLKNEKSEMSGEVVVEMVTINANSSETMFSDISSSVNSTLEKKKFPKGIYRTLQVNRVTITKIKL